MKLTQSASKLVQQLKNKDISAVELLEAHLDQIISINPDINAVVTLDEDRARERAAAADEALENLDKFLSDSLIAGFDQVLVYHGIGTGKLSRAVKEFLEIHPCVVSFHDATAKEGGYGAKIIKL